MQSSSVHTRKNGQGMTEYIIVIALVAIGAILIVGLFGKQIKHAFSRIGGAVDGTQVGQGQVTGELTTESGKLDAMNSYDGDAASAGN